MSARAEGGARLRVRMVLEATGALCCQARAFGPTREALSQ